MHFPQGSDKPRFICLCFFYFLKSLMVSMGIARTKAGSVGSLWLLVSGVVFVLVCVCVSVVCLCFVR